MYSIKIVNKCWDINKKWLKKGGVAMVCAFVLAQSEVCLPLTKMVISLKVSLHTHSFTLLCSGSLLKTPKILKLMYIKNNYCSFQAHTWNKAVVLNLH